MQIEEILKLEVLIEILKTGLLIVGGKGCGKTNTLRVLTAEIIKRQPIPIQIKMFDTACNLRWAFEPILFEEITEKTRFVYSGNKHVIFDIDLVEQIAIQKFITQVVLNDYLKQRQLKVQMEGNLLEWILYGLEETQNSLSRYALVRKEGKKLLKMISEARNFNQSFIIVGQRLADISTSLLERCQGYLFGRMFSDNDIQKVKRICGRESDIHEKVKKLDVGDFIYFNGTSAYEFHCPEYKVSTKPEEWKIEEKEKKTWKWLWGRRLFGE